MKSKKLTKLPQKALGILLLIIGLIFASHLVIPVIGLIAIYYSLKMMNQTKITKFIDSLLNNIFNH